MKRSTRLCVELLEDRCVPAVDPLLQSVASAPVSVPPPTSYVIDPPLIDPSAPPAVQPPAPTTPPVTLPPGGLILPIANPFWH